MLLSGLYFFAFVLNFFWMVLRSVIDLPIFPSAHVLVGVQVGIFDLLPLNLDGIFANNNAGMIIAALMAIDSSVEWSA